MPCTLFTVGSFVASVAHTGAHHTEAVAPTLRIETLSGRDITLSALPTAVAKTAPPGVLAVTTAENWAGG